jgi:Hsp20/alpha crystallin family
VVLHGNATAWLLSSSLQIAVFLSIPSCTCWMHELCSVAPSSVAYARRMLRMPESAALDKVKAEYINGVLVLTIPKKEVGDPSTMHSAHTCVGWDGHAWAANDFRNHRIVGNSLPHTRPMCVHLDT